MIDRILIFGDSITWGADDQEFLGWANRLRKYLQSVSENSAVYNCGIRGDTTKGLLSRFEIEANARKSKDANLIIFAIGINDSRTVDGKPQTELSEFGNNLQKIVDQAKSTSDKIVFLGLTKVVDSKASWNDYRGTLAYTETRVKEYDSTIKQIAEKNNLPYIEMYNVLEDSDLPEDGLHPDANGHEKLFNKVKNSISPQIGIS